MNKEVTSRKCNVCGIEKPVSELIANKRSYGGYMPLCKPCRNEYWKQRRNTVPGEKRRAVDRVRKSRILRKHGVSADRYQEMVIEAGDKCQLCGTKESGRNADKFRVWNVDHCHRSGRVRGLLCHLCNIGLGHLENFLRKTGHADVERYLGYSLSSVEREPINGLLDSGPERSD